MKKQFNNALVCAFVALFLFNTNTLNAQNKSSKKDKKETTKYLKAYLESSYEANEVVTLNNNYLNTAQSKKISVYPSFGFSKIRTNGRLFELSFSLNSLEYSDNVASTIPVNNPNTRVPDRGATSFNLAIGSRFEWAWRIFDGEKSMFYVGVSGNPIFSYNKIVPYTTSSFPSYKYALTTGFAVVPRWHWHVTDRFLIDVNVPFTFLQGEVSVAYMGNPVLPTFARHTEEALANFVFKPQFRIGFGIKI